MKAISPEVLSIDNLPAEQYMNSIIFIQIVFVYLIFSDFSIILMERSLIQFKPAFYSIEERLIDE